MRTRFYLGTPSWGARSWLGKVYPEGTRPTDFLSHYGRVFTTIELNTTHYRIPGHAQVRAWLDQVPPSFLFCPKFPQNISHRAYGLADKTQLRLWQEALESFGEQLGASWIQLPPHFDYGQRALLHRFLEAWPSELPLAVELRHSTWFSEGRVLPALVEYLRKKNIGLVITDVAGRRDVLHSSLSAPFTLVRFVGNELHPSDFSRAQTWAERLARWQGLKRVFFFAHQPDDILCPEMCQHLVELFNHRLEAGWRSPLMEKPLRLL